MATNTLKRLAQNLLASSNTTIYTTPNDTTATLSSIVLCNVSGILTTFNLHHLDVGATVGPLNALMYSHLISGNSTLNEGNDGRGFIFEAGQKLIGLSVNDSVVATVMGIERSNIVGSSSSSSTIGSWATPALITSNKNNYNFDNYVANGYRLSTDATRTITGFTGGTDGRVIEIRNVGSNDITFANNSGSSSSGNKILTGTGSDITITPNQMIRLIYDNTSGFWQIES